MSADKKPPTVADAAQWMKLTPQLVKLAGLCEVTDAEARESLGLPTSGFKKEVDPRDMSGIAFKGNDLSGKKRGIYQVRRHHPDMDKGKVANRWMSAAGSKNRYINTTPGKLKAGDLVIRVESVKSVWAITASAERVGRKNIKLIDTNGLMGWMLSDKDEKGDKVGVSYPNPELMSLAGHDVLDIPDSNATRSDLAPKVESFQEHLLEQVHVNNLRTVRIPQEPGVNGPDDYLSRHTDAEFWALVDAARASWRESAPPLSDFANYKIKADMLIPHVIANKSITVLAAPSEGYKTLFAFHTGRSLLTKDPLFEYFPVEKSVPYVFYNIPDMSFEMTLQYARPLGLDTSTQGFHVRTPKQGGVLQPDNPIMKAAARDGAYFVFDTMTYFLTEDVNPQVLTAFVERIRRLVELGSPGALLLAHPTKAGTRSTEIEVSEWVSGTYQKIGTVDTIFCLKKVPTSETIPDTYSVFVTREKSRPFLGVRLEPFTLGVKDHLHAGASYLEQGRFPVVTKPGETKPLSALMPAKSRGGRPETPDKETKINWLRKHLADQRGVQVTLEQLRTRLNSAFKSNHAEKLIREWLREARSDQKTIEQLQKNVSS